MSLTHHEISTIQDLMTLPELMEALEVGWEDADEELLDSRAKDIREIIEDYT